MFGNVFKLSEDFFASNLKYLFLVGLWPQDQWARDHRVLYKIYEVTLYVLLIVFLIITGIGTYQHKDDTVLLMTNLDKYLLGYYFIGKITLFIYKRTQVELLISEIINSGDTISEDHRRLMVVHILGVTGLITSIFSAFTVLALFKNEMTVDAWMPFDPLKSRMTLVLAAQLIAITFVVPCVYRGIAMQGIVCSIILYLCDQLVDVQNRLRSLEYSRETDEAMRAEFKSIIKKHIRLMGYSQAMAEIFKEYFLIQNLAVTVELCLNAVMATTVGFEQPTLLASFVAFLCTGLLNAYIYCYLGNELIIQSEDIALAAYESSWTSWPLDLQKSLLTLISAAQRPFQLTAGGMAAMSIETFAQTMYNGYSIFAVLNDVVD